jgi:hypothetical protein
VEEPSSRRGGVGRPVILALRRWARLETVLPEQLAIARLRGLPGDGVGDAGVKQSPSRCSGHLRALGLRLGLPGECRQTGEDREHDDTKLLDAVPVGQARQAQLTGAPVDQSAIAAV